MLALSLGQSGVYSILRIIERLTREVALNQQTSTLNPSVVPDRPWLDLTYQLVQIAFALVPVLLVIYLVQRSDPPAGRTLGFDLRRVRFDLGFGFVIALGIGIPGLGLYLAARALNLNTEVQASGLNAAWWTVPVLVLSAFQNAVLEEVIMIGYLFTRLTQLGWRVPLIIGGQRCGPRQLPPLPGFRRLRRQPDHGRHLRPDLSALATGRTAGRRAHAARRGGLRRLRRPGPVRGLALTSGRRQHRQGGSMANDDVPVDLYVAAYADPDRAQQDWDAIKQLVKDKVLTVEALVLISRDDDGKIHVKDNVHAVGVGAALGAIGGAVVGLIFPPALLASAAVGAGIGAGAGGVVDQVQKHQIKADVEQDPAPRHVGHRRGGRGTLGQRSAKRRWPRPRGPSTTTHTRPAEPRPGSPTGVIPRSRWLTE